MSSKAKILQAALKLFSEIGYDPASMRKLADAVGMRASSLYNHFSSKEAILAELVVQNGPSCITTSLDRLLLGSDDPQKILTQFFDLILEQWMQRDTIMLMSIFMRLPENHPAKNLVNDGVEELKLKMTDCFSMWKEKGILAQEHSAEFYFFTYMSPLLYTKTKMAASSQEFEDLESLTDMCKTDVE